MKLDGLKVVDLSLFLPGPYLTMAMADHGADVIKVEPPSGEPVRTVGYRAGGQSVWFRNTHRGKRSIVLDLKTEAGREALLALAATADVFVEAFRPGVVDRLGVGYEAVKARNPGIVYASIAAFGQTGPLVKTPAHDLAIQAYSGTLSLNLGKDGEPNNPGMPVADLTGSLVALSAILMALYRRTQTGEGDYIDISMQDALMSWLPNVTGPVFAENRAPVVQNERSFVGYAFFSVYRTADGRHVALGGVEHKFVHTLLNALDRPDLIEAACGPPGPGQAPVKRFLEATFKAKTRDDWVTWFSDKDVCFGPVLDLHEAFHAPQVESREMLFRDAEGNLHIGTPFRFRQEPGRPQTVLPALGEHTRAVLEEAGLDEGVIAEVAD